MDIAELIKKMGCGRVELNADDLDKVTGGYEHTPEERELAKKWVQFFIDQGYTRDQFVDAASASQGDPEVIAFFLEIWDSL